MATTPGPRASRAAVESRTDESVLQRRQTGNGAGAALTVSKDILTFHASEKGTLEAARRFLGLLSEARGPDRVALEDAVFRVVDVSDDGLDESLWGPTPTPQQGAAAALETVATRFAERNRLADHSWSREQAADILGVTPQSITLWLDKGDLVGFKSHGSWRIPLWQFEPDCERGVLPGVAALKRAWPGGVVSLSHWVTRPSADLDERTPRDALAAGQVKDVVTLVGSLTAAGW
ncbi:MAG TPA: helix-turn-helix domain-containing protein [Jatrophihabitans sp.]|uniref:helix-turn-helix domain-containing protein n=1 Tax=Jatrophihabitans sp. TaxID=1932789 RepID=UPI002F0CFA18